MEYVCGFLFNIVASQVALIRKKRPTWQAGRLNGIGGKVERGEEPSFSMWREFLEETGADVKHWRHFAILQGNLDHHISAGGHFCVHFYSSFTLSDLSTIIQSKTDEEIVIRSIDRRTGLHVTSDTLPNLSWLIPMALSMETERVQRFLISECM